MAAPFTPIDATAEQFAQYVAAVEASEHDTEGFLDRSVVVLYALLAPSREEARQLARRPFEWHLSRLAKLNIFPGMTRPTWEVLNEPDDEFPALDDAEYERRCETELFFDDPKGCAEKIAVLREAGGPPRGALVRGGRGGPRAPGPLPPALRRGGHAALQLKR